MENSYQKNSPNSGIHIYSDYITQDGGAFAGVTAGIWNNEIMDGAIAALYMDPSGNAGVLRGDVSGNYYPSLEMWMAEGILTPTQMAQAADLGISPQDFVDFNIGDGYLTAELSGGFASEVNEGLIEGETAWGETYFIEKGLIAQPWGIYDLKLEGPDSLDSGYDNPENSSVWFAGIEGFGEFGSAEGEWIGGTGGSWLNGEIRGALVGLYVTDEDMAGLIKGDVFGTYDEEGNTWIGESIGTFAEMGAVDESFDIDFDIDESYLFGAGSGNFESGGTLEALIEGGALNISDQDWGIWAAYLDGTYTEPNSPFKLAVAGGVYNDNIEVEEPFVYWLGTVSGDWENGLLDGDYRGVWFELNEGGESFDVGPMTGEVYGTYDEIDTTWQAAGVGDWVELAELTTNALGFDNEALAQMVSVPITETYANLLTQTDSIVTNGTITNMVMDLSIYSDLWVALLNGNYTGSPDAGWQANLGDGAYSASLSNGTWNPDGTWTADVDIVGPDTYYGAAGGTFENGSIDGVGAGVAGTRPE